MSFFENLKIIGENRRSFAPVAEVTAGHAAELALTKILTERLAHSDYEFFRGLRIPFKRGRREVDFVLIAPGELWIVELKNWSGFVGLDNGRVVQHRPAGRGTVDHGTLLKTIRLKERALKEYLEPRVEKLPPMVSVLVFWNQQVKISEELLATEDIAVMEAREFLGSLPAAPPDYGLILGAVMRLFSGGKKTAREPRRLESEEQKRLASLRQALSEIGSWDMVQLYGGRILSGDVVGFSAAALSELQGVRRLDVHAPRSYLQVFSGELGLRVVAQAHSGEEQEFDLDFEDALVFHAAGQPKPEEFPLRHVETIVFGASR